MISPANRGQGRKPGSKNKQLQELREVLYKYSDEIDLVFKEVFKTGDLDQRLKAVQMVLDRSIPKLQSIHIEQEPEEREEGPMDFDLLTFEELKLFSDLTDKALKND